MITLDENKTAKLTYDPSIETPVDAAHRFIKRHHLKSLFVDGLADLLQAPPPAKPVDIIDLI